MDDCAFTGLACGPPQVGRISFTASPWVAAKTFPTALTKRKAAAAPFWEDGESASDDDGGSDCGTPPPAIGSPSLDAYDGDDCLLSSSIIAVPWPPASDDDDHTAFAAGSILTNARTGGDGEGLCAVAATAVAPKPPQDDDGLTCSLARTVSDLGSVNARSGAALAALLGQGDDGVAVVTAAGGAGGKIDASSPAPAPAPAAPPLLLMGPPNKRARHERLGGLQKGDAPLPPLPPLPPSAKTSQRPPDAARAASPLPSIASQACVWGLPMCSIVAPGIARCV